MDEQLIAELAAQLMRAEQTRIPIEVPSISYPEMTVDDGYRMQPRDATSATTPCPCIQDKPARQMVGQTSCWRERRGARSRDERRRDSSDGEC